MNTKPTTKERIEERRSQVRVYVTYAATIYAFVGSGILIASALWVDTLDATKLTTAKDVFMTVLPVATGIITYWFASRKPEEQTPTNESGATPVASGSVEQQQGEPDRDEQGQGGERGVQNAAANQVADGPQPPEGENASRAQPIA